MDFRKAFILVPFVALFLIYSGCQASSAASVLFEKAKFTMETKGDLEGAIRLFNEIIEKHQEEREYAAKSQLYIGLCYEKQGKERAREAYQRVIQKYADQQEVAAEARTRLDALEQAVSLARPKGLLVRKVQIDSTVSGGGAISPDGRYISYADRETGDLAVYDQDSGKKRRLTDNGTGKDYLGNAEESRWSPDGKQIVYTWYNKQEFYDLRVIALDGSKPRILYSNAKEVGYVTPFAWFPDGRQILAVVYKNDGTFQIVTVSCADGSIGVLKTLGPLALGAWVIWHISLSPDGRYIVYDSTPKDSSSNHDIFLLAVDGSHEIPLVEHPAHDFVLGWAPDGKRILFASDRSGTLDAFLIKITDGKPQGAPELVKTNIGPVVPLGFTRKGSFYYFYNEGSSDIYTTELDPQTQATSWSQAKKAIERYEGYNTFGVYSPDGKYLAYVSKRGLACLGNVYYRLGNVLCVRSLETGKDRELFPQGLKSFGYPCWSPDSRFIFVFNQNDPDNRRGIYRIDTQTGETTLVVILEQFLCPWPQCSRDGKAIFLVRRDGTKDYCQIVARDLESGMEKEIYRAPSGKNIWELSLSPDGQWLAFSGYSNDTTSQKYKSALKVIPVTGGEPRELYKAAVIWSRTWTADGKYILFNSRPDRENDEGPYKWDLRRVSVAGGESQKIGLDELFWHLSAHPDGRRIAISLTGTSTYSGGIWAMENFLP